MTIDPLQMPENRSRALGTFQAVFCNRSTLERCLERILKSGTKCLFSMHNHWNDLWNALRLGERVPFHGFYRGSGGWNA